MRCIINLISAETNMAYKKLALLGFTLATLLGLAASLTVSSGLVNAVAMSGVAGSCYEGFVQSIPPAFCRKKNDGLDPSGCKAGQTKFGSQCLNSCPSGYTLNGNMCWQTCPAGYRDDGLTCFKTLFNFFFKKISAVSSSKPEYCDAGFFKEEGKCYKDCEKYGLLNCDLPACMATESTCLTSILTIPVDTVAGIGMALASVTSFDADFAASKAAVEKGYTRLGTAIVSEGIKGLKKAIAAEGKESFIKRMTTYATGAISKHVSAKLTPNVTSETVSTMCRHIGTQLLDQITSSTGVSLNFQMFDGDMINNSKDDCTYFTTNGQVICTGAFIRNMKLTDQTGIAGLAAMTMTPYCTF